MTDIQIGPLAGIDTQSPDAALQIGGDSPRLYVREALNLDLDESGRTRLRPGLNQVSTLQLANLWHSELFGDTFATSGRDWVRIDTADWQTTTTLATLGDEPVSFLEHNGEVLAAGPEGLFAYNGVTARRMTLDTPSAPGIETADDGSLDPGTYGVAIAWLRGEMESATSALATLTLSATGGMTLTFPYCFDTTVTGICTYFTRPNGGELARGLDYPIDTTQVTLTLLPKAGRATQFRHLQPMPSGRYLSWWRGRLLTVRRNILNFSEALVYHLHDPRHGFIELPQRITFLAPVEGGIWVGQVDHVLFLAGNSPDALEVQRRAGRAPVPGSACLLDAQDAGADASQGGQTTAVWLADNGYVMGTSVGMIVEPNAARLRGIRGGSGRSILCGTKIIGQST